MLGFNWTLIYAIVFGFFNDSFTGVEQGPGHMVQAGYQKGAAQAGENLVFNIQFTDGTASEFLIVRYTGALHCMHVHSI